VGNHALNGMASLPRRPKYSVSMLWGPQNLTHQYLKLCQGLTWHNDYPQRRQTSEMLINKFCLSSTYLAAHILSSTTLLCCTCTWNIVSNTGNIPCTTTHPFYGTPPHIIDKYAEKFWKAQKSTYLIIFNLLAPKFYFAYPVYKMLQKYRTKKR
jgi:hypothetical protein